MKTDEDKSLFSGDYMDHTYLLYIMKTFALEFVINKRKFTSTFRTDEVQDFDFENQLRVSKSHERLYTTRRNSPVYYVCCWRGKQVGS